MSEDLGITTVEAPASNTSKWMMKDGSFTKTGGLLVYAGFSVLFVYLVTSLLGGLVLTMGATTHTIPHFDIVAAGGLLTVFAATYVGNNALKNQAAKNAAE